MIKFTSANPIGNVIRTFNNGRQETNALVGYVLVIGPLSIWFTWAKKHRQEEIDEDQNIT